MIFKSSDSYDSYRRSKRRLKSFLLLLVLVLALPLGFFAYKPVISMMSGLMRSSDTRSTPGGNASNTSSGSGTNTPEPQKPPEIKAVYLSSDQLANGSVNALIEKLKNNGVNAVVIDVKTAEGLILYNTNIELALTVKAVAEKPIQLSGIVNKLKENNIYTIARIICFRDNKVTLKRRDMTVQTAGGGQWWFNYQKYLNPYIQLTWDYLTEIGREAADMGFDEVMLDEVKFPDAGALNLIDYGEYKDTPKEQAINGFIRYITDELHKKNVKVSLVLTPYAAFDKANENSGQDIDFANLKVDFLSPRFEPSAFKKSGTSSVTVGGVTYKGAEKNYESIIATAVKLTDERLDSTQCKAVLRPWLQAYDSGSVKFDEEKINGQITISGQNGAVGYLLFHKQGVYPFLK